MVICLGHGANLHMAQLMPLPLSLASVKSRLVLVPADLGNPGQSPEGCKTDVCVCVACMQACMHACVRVCVFVI